MRFSGVTFTLVTPVKPDYPVDEDKEDVTEAVYLFFFALLLLLELVHLIEKSCVVSVFHIFYLSIIYQTAQQTFHTLPCIDLQYSF